ncbi:MAG: restriction endonuclease subunit S [Prevotella sp.]|nr:restriction endonuclease subunit S [Prevotella sp.]
MDFTKYKISEIAKIKSGKRLPAGSNFSPTPTLYPYVRARDIKNGKINTEDFVYITEDTRKAIKKYIIEKGDIAITIVANIGDIGFCCEDCNKANLTENAVRLTDFNNVIVDSKYLSLYLNQPIMKRYMESLAAGAAQAKLGIYKIEKIKVFLPHVIYQRRIASILSAYDNLIENNNKRIRLLEQIAENLYKEWFVRFRFPGYEKTEFVNTKLGKLPKSFSISNMHSVFEDYIGGGWGNDDESEGFPISASVIRGADFPNVWHYDVSTCPRRYHKKNNYKARQLQDGDIVMEISGGTSEQPVGRTVLVTQDMIDRFEGGRVICASFCKMIRLKKEIISPYFFYFWMHYLYDTRIIDRFQLQSTGIINFKFEPFLKKGIVMLPPKELMQSFEDKINPIFKEINQLAIQNENLSRQRDLLLPRLMSGKLEV